MRRGKDLSLGWASALMLSAVTACGGVSSQGIDAPTDAGGDASIIGDAPAGGDTPIGVDAPVGGDAPVDGGAPDGGEAGPSTEVVCQALTPPASGLCSVTPGSPALLLRGTVLAPGVVYRGGAVAVDATGVITCVGCDCAAATGATTVTCANGVISPGLINTHDHLTFAQNPPFAATAERYEQRHDWRSAKRGHTAITSAGNATEDELRWAELRFLMAGATSTVGSGGAIGFLRNLDRANLQEGLSLPPVQIETFPLGDSNGTQLMAGCGYPSIQQAATLPTEASYEPHLAEGIDTVARNEFLCASSAANGGQDLLQRQTAVIHGVALTAADLNLIASDGAKLVWSPRSNVALYGDTAPVTAAARLGIPIALGTDWIVSGSMNLLRELKCADALNAGAYDRFFSDEDLWRMVTGDAALVAAAGTRLGSLAPGKVADVAVFDGTSRKPYRAIIEAEPADVALVLRGGKALYGEAAVVDAMSTGCDVVDVCGASKSVCAMSEAGKTYAALKTSGGAAYPAFFCGTPAGEPTCTPQRPKAVEGSTIYTGLPSATDQDGDGIADAQDDCPRVFNPVRPLDNGAQADTDKDGQGDACDPCPLQANVTVCPIVRGDVDGDGIPDATDNCPDEPNADQMDKDKDDRGDACDPCPNEANPGTAGCVVTIHAIKDGTVPVGTSATVTGAIVTAVRASHGFYAQSAATGGDYEGIYVFSATATVAVGDRIRAEGVVTSFFGALELGAATTTVLAQAAATPAPLEVNATDVGPAGARAQKLEGSLVTVKNVSVQSVVGTTAYVVDAGLGVGKVLYAPAALPAVDDSFASITGVLSYSTADGPRLQPRSAADVVAGPPVVRPPVLASLLPAVAAVAPGGSLTLTVTLDRPAQVGGVAVALSVTPAAAGTAPETVTVPGGSTTATFTFAATTAGDATVTATLDASTKTAAISIAVADPNGHLVINEVDYDSIGTDTLEFIEIYNPATTAKNLTNLAVVLVNGSNGLEYARINLTPAGSLPAGGYLVIANTAVTTPTGTLRLALAGNTLQNGAPDGVALVDTSTSTLIDALSYEGPVTAAQLTGITGTVSLVEGTVLPVATADSNTVEASLSRLPNGRDTNDAANDWRLSSVPTPGAANGQ
jgi:cytosine/adenosine deaminase-related metal-dependent hydrolase